MESNESTCKVIDKYLEIFGNRWNLLILYELYKGPKRFNELKRALSPITQTVLARHLRTLQENDVIERAEIPGVSLTVIYSISKSGYMVVPSMISTYGWLIEHDPELKA